MIFNVNDTVTDDVLEDELLIFPTSFAQQRLWFLDQLIPDSPLYNLPVVVRLQGRLNIVALEQSLQVIGQRHESLRTTFALIDNEAVQVIHPDSCQRLAIVDLSELSECDRQLAVEQFVIKDAQQPFDLSALPLIRTTLLKCTETEHILLLTLHHIVADLWSFNVLFRELSALYTAFTQNQPDPLPELPIQYADFAQWQRDWLQGEVKTKLLNYWTQQLSGDLPVLQLPTDRPRPAVQTFQGATDSFTVDGSILAILRGVAQQEGVTLFMLLLAAFNILLYRYTGQIDILVGTPIANRDRVEIEGLIGFFVNTLVLRTNFSSHPTVRELLKQVRQVTLDAYENQDLPFEQLVEALQIDRSLSQNPLFQVMFVFQNASIPALGDDLELSFCSVESHTAKFDLTVAIEEESDHLKVEIEYSTDLFEPDTIRRLAGHFQTLLAGIATHLEQRVSQLPLLTFAEQQQLAAWNQTQVEYSLEICLHQWIEAQVERTPDAIAVDFAGQRLTYRELNQRANQLAFYLQQQGVKPDALVGICVERSLEMVIGLLGILKAGGAYVPLDPDYPSERLALMLSDSQVSILLTQSHLVTPLPHHQAQVICLDRDWQTMAQQPDHNVYSDVTSDHLAYVIYTSGSTGKPKGAMNTHQGICNRLLWMQDAYQLTERDRVLQKTPFSFDVSVWEFFWPLMTGARLVVAQPDGHKDPAYLVQLIVEQQITTLHFVPSMLQVFLEEPGVETCSGINRIICSGEALPLSLQQRCLERLHQAELHNLYGPTEAAIDVTFWQCRTDRTLRSVPIGHPIANTQIYLLDTHLNPVPIGVPGELHIGGVGLARGYLNRPELTAERFIANPFYQAGIDQDHRSERLYKTGDLARYRPDGAIEYLGRMDDQVKIRGFRIELGEIEAALIQHPDVQEAIVVVQAEKSNQKSLVAYLVTNLLPSRIPVQCQAWLQTCQRQLIAVMIADLSIEGACLVGVPTIVQPDQPIQIGLQLPGVAEEQELAGTIVWRQGNQAGIKFNLTATQSPLLQHSVDYLLESQGFIKALQRTVTRNLRDFLRQKLPEYMIPDRMVLLRQLPLNANGKVDRRALPRVRLSRLVTEVAIVLPQTALEQQIAAVWRSLLEMDIVGIHDNFFELGGNSLLAARLVAALREAMQVKLPVRCVFEQPTIAGLAQVIIAETTCPYPQSRTTELDLQAEAVLAPEIHPANSNPKQPGQSQPPTSILLTGATGFLGAFLLQELLHQTQATIYCLVRAADDRDGLNRIRITLENYGLASVDLDPARVVPVLGDLAQPGLGLAAEVWTQLTNRIDTIYHNGADVNFFKPYSQLKATNVLGTQEILRLACQGRLKPVHYISTISIFGGTAASPIREDTAIEGHEVALDLGYSQSKWVAEKLVWIAQSRGLPVTVFRAGTIAGSSQTGIGNLKDFESSFMRGCIQLGAFPDLAESQAFAPVDYVSQAIVYLSQQSEAMGRAFHLVNPQPMPMVEWFAHIATYGYSLQKLPYQQWRDLLIAQEREHRNNPLNAFLPLYREEIDQEAMPRSESILTSSPEFDCHNVLQGLAATAISCPSVAQLSAVYLDYLIQNGLLPSPGVTP
ncbi:amino acid adenylation domain-containing protein [Pantanalinema rosaneae CENA516]|uniref:amino acid adenylation domain-containing protein n=1 Tax=Pantanalinema rosaneae TaxID=1620701 RepID=UPI003D6F6A2F